MVAIALNLADPEKPVGLDTLIAQFGSRPCERARRAGEWRLASV